jgi:p-hydroxybenzoate 3-monooxygenase
MTRGTAESVRTQVAIIGGGPAGLLLAQLLHKAGIDSVVLERRSRAYVEQRIRAGLLEEGAVRLLEQAGAAMRLHADALVHDGVNLIPDGEMFRIDLRAPDRHGGGLARRAGVGRAGDPAGS